jgi:hypothetical protein
LNEIPFDILLWLTCIRNVAVQAMATPAMWVLKGRKGVWRR